MSEEKFICQYCGRDDFTTERGKTYRQLPRPVEGGVSYDIFDEIKTDNGKSLMK